MIKLDRRQLMSGLGAAALSGPVAMGPGATAHGAAAAEGRASGDSLGALAQAAGLKFGTCIEREVFEDAEFEALVRGECTILVNERALKFDWLRPNGPEADFSFADQLVAYAERTGVPLRGHNLIWNDYLPDWLKSWPRREVASLFDSHIDETAGRYAGRIYAWDVVNEPFAPWDHEPGNFRKGAWYDALGPDYVELAFRRAKAADPKAKLVLNEAFTERDDDLGRTVRSELLALVKRLKDRDAPLDVVGLQGHLQPQFPFDDQVFARFLSDLAAEGVGLYITELDVDDRDFPADPGERDKGVARRYREFLNAVLEIDAVSVLTLWGLSDRYTWYREVAEKAGSLALKAPRPLPFDQELNRKEAWYAIAGALAARSVRRQG